jgi:hypothetical protein
VFKKRGGERKILFYLNAENGILFWKKNETKCVWSDYKSFGIHSSTVVPIPFPLLSVLSIMLILTISFSIVLINSNLVLVMFMVYDF